MWEFLRGEPDAVIRWGRWLLIAGLLLGFASANLRLPGAITAVFLAYLGAGACSLGSLAEKRRYHAAKPASWSRPGHAMIEG